MKEYNEAEMLQRMAAYCSVTERCVQEVGQKIDNARLPGEAKTRIINKLIEEKFIDEKRFCASFANDKLRFNKWGRTKIAYELRRKGIPGDLQAEAINRIDEEEYQSILLSLLKSKIKTTKGKNGYDTYMRLMRFAVSRGFESRNISTCLKTILKDEDYDEMVE